MSTWMFELYYHPPSDLAMEAELTSAVASFGGWLDCREAPEVGGSPSVCLTYEFSEVSTAERAAEQLRSRGHHVEGVTLYT